MPSTRQGRDDEATEDPSELPEPPTKKSRHGRRSTSPKPEGAVEKRRKKRNKIASQDKNSSPRKLKYDVPIRVKSRFIIYNSKFKKSHKYCSCKEGADSSKEGSGETSQAEPGPSGSVVGNNNEVTEKAGGSGKRRRRHKKRPTKVDQDTVPTKKVRKGKTEKDSGVGSLADLLDGMSVGEKRKTTATVSSKKTVFDLEQVERHKKMKRDEENRKAATVTALRSTVVVEGIPHPMLFHIGSSIHAFFASCGPIIHYSTHEFLQEDQFTFSATVHFGCEDAASKALAMDGYCFGGVAVRVRRAGPLEGLDGRNGLAARRPNGMQPFCLTPPRLGVAIDGVQYFYYPCSARDLASEGPSCDQRFARAEISSDSD